MAKWKRPNSVAFPSIWRTFEGKKEVNGNKRKYWVQDVSDEYVDAFINYITTGLLNEEIVCKYLGIIDDLQSKQEILEMWRGTVKEKLSLICLTTNEKGIIQIAGGNFVARAYKGYKSGVDNIKGKAYRNYTTAKKYMYQVRDIYSELGIDSYLTSMGLYVLPEYRGEGIGLEILKARREMCLAVGIPVFANLFSAPNSQHLAAKAGFKDFVKVTFEEIEKENPECRLSGISEVSKYSKLMYIKYD